VESALIILKGEEPSRLLLMEFWDQTDYRVCADGAASLLKKYGLTPDVILGDLDSIRTSEKQHFNAIKTIQIADQSTTDGEKAIAHCAEKGINKLVVLGALGKRLDHTLYNLGLFKRTVQLGIDITFYTNHEKLRVIEKTTTFLEDKGTVISLMPLYGRVNGVTTQGLTYPINDETLEMGLFSSVSNEFSQNEAIISLTKGQLLIVISREVARWMPADITNPQT
jgi:thiamine pyrophosphokinase